MMDKYLWTDVPREVVKEMAKVDRDQLAPYEVTPEEQYLTGRKRYLNPKNCYEKAFEYTASKSELPVMLVHGKYRSPAMDMPSNHAWVELPGEIIFDGVLQRFYDKEKYAAYYDIQEENRYTPSEMYRIGRLNNGHYGPWV